MTMTQFRQKLEAVLVASLMVIVWQPAVADDVEWAMQMCSVIDGMGAQTKCVVTASEHAVDVTIDTTAVDATEFCATYSKMLDALASMMSGDWTMRIFSNNAPDTPAAVCDLG